MWPEAHILRFLETTVTTVPFDDLVLGPGIARNKPRSATVVPQSREKSPSFPLKVKPHLVFQCFVSAYFQPKFG